MSQIVEVKANLDSVLHADAEDVARRTLRYNFGRLSNRGIVARVRALASEESCGISDGEMLYRWFDQYDRAMKRMRSERSARPPTGMNAH